MEQNNEDIVIGEEEKIIEEHEEDQNSGQPIEEIESTVDGHEFGASSTRVPPAPRRIELLDCNSLNALMYHYYGQGEYTECKSLIGEIMSKYKGMNEKAMHIRGCIARIEGNLDEALDWFTKAFEQSGKKNEYYYDIGRVNFLLGRHSLAVEQLEKAVVALPHNPKVIYWLARAVYHLPPRKLKGHVFNPVETARDLILGSPHIASDVVLVCFLGKLSEELNEVQSAIQAYKRALELQPDNTDVMIRLGLLNLRTGNADNGFEVIGKCLAYDPGNSDAILAIGSILQSHSDHDVALNKYRVATEACDYNGCLWNNIGVGLMARDKLAAAHSALKKAAFINPLNYKISYNLGLLHETMSLNCSALHYIKLSSELSPNNPKIIGAMGVILSHMRDAKNARKAYLKSIEIGATPSVLLNYAIFEYHQRNLSDSSKVLEQFRKLQESGVHCSQSQLSVAEVLDGVLKTNGGGGVEDEEY